MEIPVVTNNGSTIRRMVSVSTLEGACYLCGLKTEKEKLTREHLVARTFFKPNTLQNPLILNACKQCNNTKGKTEEKVSTLFRLFTDSASVKPATKRLLDSANMTKKLVYPNGRDSRQHRHIGGRQLELVIANIQSPQGLIKKRFFTLMSKLTDSDVKAVHRLYIDIAKGLIVLATQQLYAWKNYSLSCEWSYPYDMAGHQKLFLNLLQTIMQSPDFKESWADVKGDPSLEISGTLLPNNDDKIVDSVWFINFYGRQVGVVTLINKDSSNYKLEQERKSDKNKTHK